MIEPSIDEIHRTLFRHDRKVIMFPLLHVTVWTWLDTDYNLRLEGSYCRAGDFIEALCFLKGIRSN